MATHVAIIGGGISGLSAAYNLWKLSHGEIRVTIYEAEEQLGGHSCTIKHPSIKRPIDIGFQVFNDHTYPLFKQFLQELDVEICDSNMSFSVETDNGFVWGTRTATSLFKSFMRHPLRMLVFIRGLSHFFACANSYIQRIDNNADKQMQLQDFANDNGIGVHILKGFILPFTSSVWSVSEGKAETFDAYTVFKFMSNHHLLTFSNLTWKTIQNSSLDYVQKMLAKCQPDVEVGCTVRSVTRQDSSGKWIVNDMVAIEYDYVVLALHGNQAVQIDISSKGSDRNQVEEYKTLLQKVQYVENNLIIHSDESVMPEQKDAWSSWNFKNGVVTYWENSLQPIGFEHNVFVTVVHSGQMENVHIENSKLLCPVRKMSHPCSLQENIDIGKLLIQGVSGLFACGAYMGYGFHEDGYRSGMEIALAVTKSKLEHTVVKYTQKMSGWFSYILTMPVQTAVRKAFSYIFGSSIKRGCIGIQMPNAEVCFYGRSNMTSVLLAVKSDMALVRCLLRGDIGFAESFMLGEIETDNLPLLIKYILQEDPSPVRRKWYDTMLSKVFLSWFKISYIRLSQNNPELAKQNIADHYDLGNEFFAAFLDETMTYSSGIFNISTDSLKDAQLRKYQALIDDLDIGADSCVLEIGTGWGGFACYVAETKGCKVTTVTISHQQAVYAHELVKTKGLQNLINIFEIDYRDILQKFPCGYFDAVVSIEMIEAVGPQNYDLYFEAIDQCLNAQGRAGLQAITRFEDNYDNNKTRPDFINQYIFPGGCLPSLGAVSRHATRNGLIVNKATNIAKSYVTTLEKWRHNFLEYANETKFPYDDCFKRKWDLYFAICQAAFDVGVIQDYQIILGKLNLSTE